MTLLTVAQACFKGDYELSKSLSQTTLVLCQTGVSCLGGRAILQMMIMGGALSMGNNGGKIIHDGFTS